tara:strand:+ start:3123 stop:4220 length:1098 start_codon:yes stop_codon:yes gene_type:complete
MGDKKHIETKFTSAELNRLDLPVANFEKKNIQLEEVLLKMNELQNALDSSSIVAITNARGMLTYVNDKFCEISNYSRLELYGKNHSIVSSGDHAKSFWAEMWQTISTGKVWNAEVKNVGKKLEIYWVDMTIVPYLNERNVPYKYIAIQRDITEKKISDQRILSSIIKDQEHDREIFAEDLHEGLAQALAGLMMQVGIIEFKTQEIKDVELQASIKFIKSYIEESIDNTRIMASSLMPRTMIKYGIEPSLRSYISSIQKEGRRYIQFKCKILTPVDKDSEITLYRTIIAAMAKFRNNDIISIVIFVSSGENACLIATIDVKSTKEYLDACSFQNLGFESNKKRIESLGGYFRLQKLNSLLRISIKL